MVENYKDQNFELSFLAEEIVAEEIVEEGDMEMKMVIDMEVEVVEEEVIAEEIVVEIEEEIEVAGEEDLTTRTQSVSTVMALAIGLVIVLANATVENATTAVNSDIKPVIARRDLVPHHTLAEVVVEAAAPKEEVLEVQNQDRLEDQEAQKKAEADPRATVEVEARREQRVDLPVETMQPRVDLDQDLIPDHAPKARVQSRNLRAEVEADPRVPEKAARVLLDLVLHLLIN
jgi:hypothetical protein